jgi:hypothetical protein
VKQMCGADRVNSIERRDSQITTHGVSGLAVMKADAQQRVTYSSTGKHGSLEYRVIVSGLPIARMCVAGD